MWTDSAALDCFRCLLWILRSHDFDGFLKKQQPFHILICLVIKARNNLRSQEEHILRYSFLSQQFDLISSASLQHIPIGSRYSQNGLFMGHNLRLSNELSLSATSLIPTVMKEFSVHYRDLQESRHFFFYYTSEWVLWKHPSRSTLSVRWNYCGCFTFGGVLWFQIHCLLFRVCFCYDCGNCTMASASFSCSCIFHAALCPSRECRTCWSGWILN